MIRLNRGISTFFCAASLCACIQNVRAYEIHTHGDMSIVAANKAQNLGNTLFNLGFSGSTDKLKLDGDTKSIEGWIEEGAIREDDTWTESFARYKHHFYDPTTGRGFGGILWRDSGIVSGMPAPDWAIDKGEADGQLYSFKQARLYFYDGLTQSTKAERESKLATMFRTLGDVVHIVQDMAQPQHTRNDGHGFPKSYYEVYTDDNRRSLPYSSSSVTIPGFSNARDFFVNSSWKKNGVSSNIPTFPAIISKWPDHSDLNSREHFTMSPPEGIIAKTFFCATKIARIGGMY